MSIDLKSINSSLKGKLNEIKFDYEIADAGVITYSGDGIIRADGLSKARYFEVLEIENGSQALALNLNENDIGAVILDNDANVMQGMTVKTTGKLLEVPVGDVMLGRVINPLGKQLDGKGEIVSARTRCIENSAPQIINRAKVDSAIQTGLISIDSMIPIGKGQRELIIGDRQTGKTAIAVDAIINQKGKNIYCVYVAIGQKTSSVAEIVRRLNEHGAMDYTVVVSCTAKDSAPMQYIAPYCGCAIAEEFMYDGKDVLIIYDDLSKHAVAYRTLSLLLRRPAGREAYPGDIFYLHSRLLERAAHLNSDNGGGSMTALPIVETQAGDISAYIPTNVISITDGQIFLESELFHSGVRPAVNVGLSVSRVGGSAQSKAMRTVSGGLRLELAQYRELAVFTQFGSDLDKATKNAIIKGEKLTELLKQGQYKPLDVAQQVIILYSMSRPEIEKVEASRIRLFRQLFIEYIEMHHFDITAEIRRNELLTEEIKLAIDKAVSLFVPQFLASH